MTQVNAVLVVTIVFGDNGLSVTNGGDKVVVRWEYFEKDETSTKSVLITH